MDTANDKNLSLKKEAITNSHFVLEELNKIKKKPEGFFKFVKTLKNYCRFLGASYPNHREWNDEIFELWVVLEETYAIAASLGQTSLSPEKMKLVEETCARIRIMIEGHIAEF